MVHLLEERLGVALFERKANRLTLTPAGRAYQNGLTPIFDALASLTAQVTAPASVRVLTIGVGPTFAMRWLIPRLVDFSKKQPDIDVRITAGGIAVPFGDDWSCGIKLGDGNWPGLVAEPLFAADLLPVCAPKFAVSLKRPGDLKAQNLIRVAHASEDWPLWLKAAGAARLTARGPEFQYYGQAIQAASDGLGIAMGISPYIDDDLAAGRLVAPFALSVPKGMRWYLVYRSFQTEQRDFAAFRRWIMQAAAAPVARRKAGAQKRAHHVNGFTKFSADS
jgi:LysR family glycine cleavage system transcriptional activator